jgi:hypothetical protein
MLHSNRTERGIETPSKGIYLCVSQAKVDMRTPVIGLEPLEALARNRNRLWKGKDISSVVPINIP